MKYNAEKEPVREIGYNYTKVPVYVRCFLTYVNVFNESSGEAIHEADKISAFSSFH